MDKIKSRKRALILSVIVCVLSFLLLTILENTMKPAIDESKDSDKIAITEEFEIQCAYNSSLRKYVTTITGKIKNLTKSRLDNLILIFSVEASGIPYQYEREALSIGTENELRVQTAFQSSEQFRKLRGVQARFGDNPPLYGKKLRRVAFGQTVDTHSQCNRGGFLCSSHRICGSLRENGFQEGKTRRTEDTSPITRFGDLRRLRILRRKKLARCGQMQVLRRADRLLNVK